jgi:hypothetical protein
VPECGQLAADEAGALAAERGTSDTASTLAIGTIAAMPPVIVLCHNPVTAEDHPSCGGAGLAPRTGDIRYNTVLNIDKPQQPSAWGIMVDADDPLTGEKVAASINIWTHITDIASQGLVDLVKYINGELKTSDITEGTYITNWAKAAQLGADGTGPSMTGTRSTERMRGRVGHRSEELKKGIPRPRAAGPAGPDPQVLDTAESRPTSPSHGRRSEPLRPA